MHGYRIAAALGSPRLIVPSGAGVMSAIGFLAAPIAFDFTRSFPGRLDALDWARVNGLIAEMEEEGTALLASAGVRGRDVTHRRAAEMRYVGQGHEVRVPLPPGPLTPASVPALRAGVRDRVPPPLRPARPAGAGGSDHLAGRLRPVRAPISVCRPRRRRRAMPSRRAKARAGPTCRSRAG